jgi:hypothetical protein
VEGLQAVSPLIRRMRSSPRNLSISSLPDFPDFKEGQPAGEGEILHHHEIAGLRRRS